MVVDEFKKRKLPLKRHRHGLPLMRIFKRQRHTSGDEHQRVLFGRELADLCVNGKPCPPIMVSAIQSSFIRETHFYRVRLLRSMLPFRGLSVCHVRAVCSNGRRYRHDFFCLYDSPISLPDRFKIWLPSVYPFLSKYYPKVTHPLQKGNAAVMLVMRFVVGSPLLSIFSAAFNGTEMVLYAPVCLSETTRVLI